MESGGNRGKEKELECRLSAELAIIKVFCFSILTKYVMF